MKHIDTTAPEDSTAADLFDDVLEVICGIARNGVNCTNATVEIYQILGLKA